LASCSAKKAVENDGLQQQLRTSSLRSGMLILKKFKR
jgi:hypothetical protein